MARILLVDDENLILYSLSKTLKNDGSEVKAVANGKDALNEIRSSPYDICFLDVNLPDSNGLDLMKLVREISPSTRVVIMTAVDLNDGQMKCVQSNAGYFLPKPFDLDEVRSIVHSIGEPPEPPAYNA